MTDWIHHDGGPCPVPPETMVQFVGRYSKPKNDKCIAADLYWNNIVRYRIVSPQPPASPVRMVPKIEAALQEIGEALRKSREKHKPMHSAHEGYAILLEEVDELWDEVKAWQPPGRYKPKADCPDCHGKGSVWLGGQGGDYENCHCMTDYERESKARMRKEALHVAAMSLAFLVEVCDRETADE